MLTVILSAVPPDELFASGLALCLDAADSPQPPVALLSDPLASALLHPETTASEQALLRARRQLGQLELFGIETCSTAEALPALLSFVRHLTPAELQDLLQRSGAVLTF